MNSEPCKDFYFSKMNKMVWVFYEIYQCVNYSFFSALLHICWLHGEKYEGSININ